jgi:prepilin-type N-terminal cleavage/methylation domain-containing protein
MRPLKLSDGFTLMEVLLVVAIITIITAVSAPLVLAFQNSNELDVAGNTLAQYLYEAQSYSSNEAHDCSWGVTINNQNLTLFCGDSYSGREPEFDVIYAIPNNIIVQNNSEINFSKMTGLPKSTGSFRLTTAGNRSATVTVNNKGMVDY